MLVLLLALSSIASSAGARTWLIEPDGTGDAPTIQAGVDSAQTGDDVLLAPGTYSWTSQAPTGASMVEMKPGIWLHSESGAQTTILDAEQQGRLVLCQDVGNQVRIEGLTLKNGRDSSDFNPGGGGALIAVGDSEPTILDCVFQDNAAIQSPNGGGIFCDVATIENCTFLGNFGKAGGALLCGAAQVSNCEFRSNGAGDGGFGGAIAARSGTVISNSIFEDNVCGSGMVAVGGAIDARGAVTITSSIFVNNFASGIWGEGGAVSFFSGSTGVVRDCVFIGNSAHGPLPNRGGAISAREGALVENCTIMASSGGHSGGVGGIWMDGGGVVRNVIIAQTTAGQACGGNPGPTWTCNNLFGNVLGDAICGTDGGGNFSDDPQFCDSDPIASFNVTLRQSSPCAPGNHPDGTSCGLIGAGPVACGSVSIQNATWGMVKTLYR